MTVYVDQSIFPYRGTKYCHVWADTIDELHAAAQAVGLRREWFQQPPKASWQHYDCAPRIRALLIKNGAVETDKFGPLYWQALQLIRRGFGVLGWKRLAMVCDVRDIPLDMFGPVNVKP